MTDAHRIGWGIVGLGRIADSEIAPAIGAADNSTLVGVVSRDAGRARDFAARHGAAAAHDDYAALLADPAVDAVYIATPNGLHAEQVVAAAAAGKHVLCDKPLATSVPDAERAVAACREAGVRLGITFQTRRHEGMQDVRNLLAAERIGDVRLVQVELGPGRMLPKSWRTDPGLAGAGVMNNMGVHAYDLLRYLLGAEVVEATAVVDVEPGFQVDTLALAVLRFDNGALAYVNANQSLPNPQQDLSVYGTEGTVLGRNVTRPNLTGTLTVLGRDGTSERSVSSAGAFVATVSAFADSVLRGEEPSPSGVDGLRSVELTTALARSAQERRTIPLGR
ncbi:1,5-anhydro-D-fructose reductase (1,5-anhydro-D-mannitol-forming) [Geodermatophilus africanus]|uniref:1,5-anhydro-D-fructose reductase (1,5-anhydro-D-mannitol-forming) n=1 Tax=Geodermatophilus africanus TaxID=1137993 RepID=A0A1H3EXK7_9ACTN|nr:Gfo/Idh/MocA family oxidoreductase [Geodermatophilus africanus]SDX83542.1 1,5-anhydro-D-fructose reductase (1,5-anhydro-D-mannitol-forming) [Geodermatophilus africanus]